MFLEVATIFIDIVTPVFFLVFLGYFVGPRLGLDAKTLSRTAYFILLPCFTFNVLSQMTVELSAAGQMILYTTLTHLLAAGIAFQERAAAVPGHRATGGRPSGGLIRYSRAAHDSRGVENSADAGV